MRRIGILSGRLRGALFAAALAAGVSGAAVAEPDAPDDGEPVAVDPQPAPEGRDGTDASEADDADADAAAPLPGEDERAHWERRATAARQRVEKARARVTAAEAAYQSMRQRSYPRGEAKDAIVREVEASKKALADAEARVEGLGGAARDADVPPAWIELD